VITTPNQVSMSLDLDVRTGVFAFFATVGVWNCVVNFVRGFREGWNEAQGED
jgi:hypothetical protein